MPGTRSDAESWRTIVLRSMPPPAWLKNPGPELDVVLSSRTRIMRNLWGFRFPHHAGVEELLAVRAQVVTAFMASSARVRFEEVRQASPAERNYMVACRLVSPDFAWSEPGRALLLNDDRALSLMVNEEDHIRLQAVTAGWSPGLAGSLAFACLEEAAGRLRFAESPTLGYLASSPFNCGKGVRDSALLHLVGMANAKRLSKALQAIAARGLTARGLFGESSRAVGAFVQVSQTSGPKEDFLGAVAYLLEEERAARSAVPEEQLRARLSGCIRYVRSARGVSLAEALRVLAWLRWGASARLPPIQAHVRDVDRWLTLLGLGISAEETKAARQRAQFLRECLGQ